MSQNSLDNWMSGLQRVRTAWITRRQLQELRKESKRKKRQLQELRKEAKNRRMMMMMIMKYYLQQQLSASVLAQKQLVTCSREI